MKLLAQKNLNTLKKCAFVGLSGLFLIFSGKSLAQENTLPTALENESLFELIEVPAPDESEEIPANVVKYYNPDEDPDIHYYIISFKNPVIGSGSAAKYFKWVQNENGYVHLEETTEPSESILTVYYDPTTPEDKIVVERNTEVGEINAEYYAQDINKSISVKGSVDTINAKFVGNELEIPADNSYDYSALLIEADTSAGDPNGIPSEAEYLNASFIGNNVNINSNRTYAVYGSLLKTLSRLGHLTTEFIGNIIHTDSTNLNGGLIELPQEGSIATLTGDFINNTIISESANVDGGAINNYGIISTLQNSKFIKNIIYNQSGKASGGAIYNNAFDLVNGIVDSFFSGNAVISDSAQVAGGAIYNRANTSITNSIFIDNFAKSLTGNAYGGAIYSDTNITINANNGKTTEFTGNYVINKGVREDQAIYVSNKDLSLTLSATDNGHIIMNDIINGAYGFRTILNGDDSGTIEINNDIKRSNVTASGTNIVLSNGTIKDHELISLTSMDTARWTIDVDFENQTADSLTVGTGSGGTVILDQLNILSAMPTETTTFKIINSDEDSIGLGLSDKIITDYANRTETNPEDIADEVYATTFWDKEYFTHQEYEITTEGLRLVKSNNNLTHEDSLQYFVEHSKEILNAHKTDDTLRLVNQLNASERRFQANGADDVYTLENNAGSTASGTMNLIGVYDTDTELSSTVNAGNYTLFELDNDDTILNIRNVNLITSNDADGSLLNITNNSAIANLYGTNLNITGVVGSNAIYNDGTLNILGSFTSNTGIIGDDGTLNIGSNGSLTLTDGASITQNQINLTGTVDGTANLTLDDDGTLNGTLNINQYGTASVITVNLNGDVVVDGNLYLRGSGTIDDNISGDGSVYINGTIDIDDNTIFSAANLVYTEDNTIVNTIADNLITTISREAGTDSSTQVLNLYGGTLNSGINVNHQFTTNIIGDVTFANTGDRSIYSKVVVGEGNSLTVNNFSVFNGNGGTNPATITNNGSLYLDSGGVWDANHGATITGTGTTHVTGNVITQKTFNQDKVYIDRDATLRTKTNGITANQFINNGIWEIVPLNSDFVSEANIKSRQITGSGTIKALSGGSNTAIQISGIKIDQDFINTGNLYISPFALNGTVQEGNVTTGTFTNIGTMRFHTGNTAATPIVKAILGTG
ncbi:MAG: hypothetical protein J6W96_03815, partial [Alphaproteobacteria bacterium]|nr:hypothetical protein [Alphaproteobacteria bacterium]